MYYYYTIRLRVLYVAENGALGLCKQNILVVPELYSIFTHHSHTIVYIVRRAFSFVNQYHAYNDPLRKEGPQLCGFINKHVFFQLWNLKLDPVLPICSRLRPLYLPIVRHKVLGALLITQKFPMTLKGIKPREKAMYSGQMEMARLLVFPPYTFITYENRQ